MTQYRAAFLTILLPAIVICTGVRAIASATPTAYHVTDLGTLGGIFSIGYAINDSGQVTGRSNTAGEDGYHAFLWTPTTPNGASGVMIDLGSLGGRLGGGAAINNIGRVVGYSNFPGDTAYHAFLYDGTMHDLGTLGGTHSSGEGVNDSDQVIGWSYTAGNARHAFLYMSGSGMVDLNSLIDPLLGWVLYGATGINDNGQITGYGVIGGQTDAVLLTPIPEPASIVLLELGLPMLHWSSSLQRGTYMFRSVKSV